MTAAGIWWRLARSQPALLAIAVVATALASGLLATGARSFHEVAVDDLIHAVDEGPPPARRIDYVVESRIGIGPVDPMAQVRRHGDRFLDERVPEPVAAILDPSRFVVDSAPYDISSFPDDADGPFELSIALRHQEGIEEHVSLISGKLPGEPRTVDVLRGPDCPADRLDVAAFVDEDELDCEIERLPVHDVALTPESARDLLVDVGDRVLLRPQALDPLWAPVFGSDLSGRVVLEVSGLVELSSPDNPFWFGDTRLHRPVVTENSDFRIVEALGYMPAERYQSWLRERLGVRWRYTWRFPVAAERIPVDEAEAVAADVAQISAPDGRVSTRLDAAIGEHVDQRSLALAVASISSSGVISLAVFGVWSIVSLAMRREARGWRTLETRGASRVTLITIGVLHGLAIAVPAAIAGSLVARAVVSNAPWATAICLVLTLGILVVVTATAAMRRRDDGLVSSDSASTRAARRAVRDVLIVVLAIGALLLSVRREGTGGLDRSGGLDLLLAATSPLIALALAIVTVRVMPGLIVALSAVGGRFDGVVGFLGSRRLADRASAVPVSATIIVLATAVGGVAGSLRASLPEIDDADPFPMWIERGLELLVVYSIANAFVGVVAGLAMTAWARRRLLATLYTLGASPHELAGITSLGQLVATFVAAIGGIAAAAVALVGVGSALDFGLFAASDSGIEEAPIQLDRLLLLIIGAAVIVAAIVASVMAIRLDRRSVETSSLVEGGLR